MAFTALIFLLLAIASVPSALLVYLTKKPTPALANYYLRFRAGKKGVKQAPKPKCWRILGVPAGCTRGQLFCALQTLHSSLADLDEEWLALYPSCSDASQTALLDLGKNLAYFETLSDEEEKHIEVVVETHRVDLSIGCCFDNITPLSAPKGEILADLVAVTGLAGNAYGSWRNSGNRRMWLRDFLPADFPFLRIMTYGYRSNLTGDVDDLQNSLDYTKGLLQALNIIRATDEEKNRPLIFVTHSMGGILVLQALLKSKSNPAFRHILQATSTAHFFFAVPHQGMDIENLLQILGPNASTRKDLVTQLGKGSVFLQNQREDIMHLWDELEQPDTYSFYETKKTPVAEKDASGHWKRGRSKKELVSAMSARVFWPREQEIPADADHSEIVKFQAKTDRTYLSLKTHLKKAVDKIVKARKEEENAIDDAFREIVRKCLNSLDASVSDSHDRREELLAKQLEGTCSWLIADKRYREWMEHEESILLWIHGKPGSGKSVLSAFLTKTLASQRYTRPPPIEERQLLDRIEDVDGNGYQLSTPSTDNETPTDLVLHRTHSMDHSTLSVEDVPHNACAKTWERRVSVAYFFCRGTDESLRTDASILKHLLAQLLHQSPAAAYPHFEAEFENIMNGKRTQWTIGMLWRVFESILMDHNLDNTVLIIDALDECEEDLRYNFLQRLQALLKPSLIANTKVKLIITSRPNVAVTEGNITNCSITIPLDTKGVNKDICHYVATEVHELVLRRNLASLEQEIRDTLVNGANGMFLWASLILEDLKKTKQTRPKIIRQKLQELPEDITEIYRRILEEVPDEDADQARKALQCIVYAARPMALEELGTAMAVMPIHTCLEDMADEIDLDLKRFLQLTFGSLLTVTEGVVNLIHQTAKDFLTDAVPDTSDSKDSRAATEVTVYNHGKKIPSDPRARFGLSVKEGNLTLAISCLSYLCFDAFEIGPASRERYFDKTVDTAVADVVSRHSFFLYVAKYWGDHLRYIGRPEEMEHAHESLPKLFQTLARSVRKINLAYQYYRIDVLWGFNWARAIVIASRLGVYPLVRIEIEGGQCGWKDYLHAINEAAANNRAAIIQLILERVGHICTLKSAMLSAAGNGHEEVVRLLLRMAGDSAERDLGIDSALRSAASLGRRKVVQILVQAGANVNLASHLTEAPLSAAARNGHQSVVEVLLDCGAELNYPNSPACRNALFSAVEAGHQELVKFLLDRGATVDRQGELLAAAYEKGQQNMVYFLVAQGFRFYA